MNQPVILCGVGRVGSRVLELLRTVGLQVVAVDPACEPGDPRLLNVRLVQGDCRNREVLLDAGVARARGVLILTSDDLVNISTALMVRSLNSEVRIVVRMFNQNLVPRLGKTIKNIYALSVSALSAPVLALTALTGDALGTFALEDGRRQVTELRVSEHSLLPGRTISEAIARQRMVVLAHLPADGDHRFLLDVRPDTRLAPGDHLVICGEPRELSQLLAQAGEEPLSHVRWAGNLRRLFRVVQRTLGEVDLPVKICTTVFLSVVLASTLVYRLGIMGEERSWADALYRTISVMATGADMHEDELRMPWQKAFVSILKVAGAAVTAAFTAILTNYLLRARLGGALEVRRIPDSGHIIVCGLGNVGFRVVEELLHYGERVVVIELERDSRFMATARRLGVAVIVGDATVLEVLRQAHAGTARAIVAATSNELVNLEVALLARELNARQRVVVRLSDAHLAQTLREAADVRLALSIPTLAAPAFMAALFGDRVQSVFLVGAVLLAVVELVVQPDDHFLNGQSVRSLALDYRFAPVNLVSADRAARPDMLGQKLLVGDRLTVIAAVNDLEGVLRREPRPTDWQVCLKAVPDSARSRAIHLLAERQGLPVEEAERRLDQLPISLATHLTWGLAQELVEQLQNEEIACESQRMSRS